MITRSFNKIDLDLAVVEAEIAGVVISTNKITSVQSNSTLTLEGNGTGKITLNDDTKVNGSLSTSKDVVFHSDFALIADDSSGEFSNRSGTNIDHIWHNDTTNSWNFVSDGTYRKDGISGSSTLRAQHLALGSHLTVNGNTVLGNANTDSTTARGTVTLSDAGKLTNIKGTLNVDQAVSFDSTLNVASTTTLNSTLTVNGSTTLKSNLTVNGNTVLGNANTDTSVIRGTLTLSDLDKLTTIKGSLRINQDLVIDKALNVTNDLVVGDFNDSNSNITVLAGETKIAQISAYGSSQGTGIVYVGQSSSHGGGIVYNGDDNPNLPFSTDSISMFRRSSGVDYEIIHASHGSSRVLFNDSITIEGTSDSSSTITGSFQTKGGVGIAKKLYVGTSVYAPTYYDLNNTGYYGNFASTSRMNLLNLTTLNVYGITTLGDAVTDSTRIRGTVTISDNTKLTKIEGKLTVDEATILSSTLNVNGNTTLGNAVTDSTTIRGTVTIGDDTKNTRIGGTLSVDETATFSGIINANAGIKQDNFSILNGSDTWLRTSGNTGWYSATHGGGMYMTDTTWVQTYADKGLSGRVLRSTVAQGTAPLVVTSTTKVAKLNVDYLDGQDISYYRNATNLNAGTISDARLPNIITSDIKGIKYVDSSNEMTLAQGFVGGRLYLNYRGATSAITELYIANGRGATTTNVIARQYTSNVAQGTAPLIVASSTKVTNLNADYLDGQTLTSAGTANTVVGRDGSGDINARLFKSTYGTTSSLAATADICFRNSTSDNYLRFVDHAGIISWIGKVNDSQKLDNLDSTQFLRSDTADTYTSLSGGRLTATGTGNNYTNGGIEVRSSGSAIPTIGFHKPGAFAGELQLRANNEFYFRNNGDTGNANVTAEVFRGKATSANYADVAENYLSDSVQVPGTVMGIGGENEIAVWTEGMPLAGVVSTNPALIMNNEDSIKDNELYLEIALKGKIPCFIEGEAKKGQYLVPSSNGKAKVSTTYNPEFNIGVCIEDSVNGTVMVKV